MVHFSPSSQFLGTLVQAPVTESHMSVVQGLLSLQTLRLVYSQVPSAVQIACIQTLPVSQSASLSHAGQPISESGV